jgi:hypothetical protein
LKSGKNQIIWWLIAKVFKNKLVRLGVRSTVFVLVGASTPRRHLYIDIKKKYYDEKKFGRNPKSDLD